MKYEQANLDRADEKELEADRLAYEADRSRDLYLNGEHGIDQVMNTMELDALLFPDNLNGRSGLAARPGYPTVMVPFARVMEEYDPPLPDGFEPLPRPFGVGFTGMACSEPRLLELAYAFEQATLRRVPPPSFP